ncbi:MAG: LysM peptidoglycan-binding domain-containing protein [Roseiflexaceae bacterium]|nr:LysM peptidoglycan-binding domain-containing protein [Roseiflexus sp.]MDW8214470.1 LysM peptidoglycan-binding domain-containing protein [Roseiflexaceae bacterium]
MMVRSPTTVVIVVLAIAAVVVGWLVTTLSDMWSMASAPSIFMTAAARSATVSTAAALAMPAGGNVTSAPTPAGISPTASETLAVSPTESTPVSTGAPTITAPAATALPTVTEAQTAALTAIALPTATEAPTAAPTATAPPMVTEAPTAAPTINPTIVLATPTTDVSQETPFVEYVVQRGDTLYAIAKLFNVSIEDILANNTVPNPSSLTIGQTLRIPTSEVAYVEYVVQRGDLLVTIARRFGVSVEDILAVNDIRNPSSLTIRETLRIPRRLP